MASSPPFPIGLAMAKMTPRQFDQFRQGVKDILAQDEPLSFWAYIRAGCTSPVLKALDELAMTCLRSDP